MDRLAGKVAVITGGSDGIGRAIARKFVAEGAHVVLFARRIEVLSQATAELGDAATGVAGDITVLLDLERLARETEARHGKVDIVVANAGSTASTLLADVTEESFDAIVNLNLKGNFFTVQKLLPLLRRPASVILVGSVAANMGLAGASVYAASKAAVRSLAQNWAAELGPSGIRVNVLSPGITKTPLVDRLIEYEKAGAGFAAMVSERTPLGRLGRPEELAAAAAFLASEDSSYITGVNLSVDGGLTQV